MVAYLFRMPAGIAGEISRFDGATVEPQTITAGPATDSPTEYGLAVQIDATTGNIRPVKAADTAVYGLLVRPYPTNSGQEALGVGTPNQTAGAECNVMRRGYMTVKLRTGTAVKGAPAYVWKAAASGGNIPGGFTATDPTTSGIALPATFVGAADANGNVEIAYNI